MIYSIETLKCEYGEKVSLYEELAIQLTTQIKELLRQNNILLPFPIQSRIKEWSSICEKYKNSTLKPKALEELTDITGLRVVTLFRRDLDKVCKIITENFDILKKEDLGEKLSEDRFGYVSIHFDITPKDAWYSVPTLRKLKGLSAELQVRTIAQHIWASSSHFLQYKRESHVPIPVRRAINRVAALLETVDLEFERVLTDRERYKEDAKSLDKKEFLNTDNLAHFMDEKLPPQNKDKEEDYAELLDDIKHFNINSIEDLEKLVDKHLSIVMEKDKARVEREKQDKKSKREFLSQRLSENVFFTHSGLIRGVFAIEFGKTWSEYLDKRYSSKK